MTTTAKHPTTLASANRLVQSLRTSRDDWKAKNSEKRIESKRLRELVRDHQARTKDLKLKCKGQANTIASRERELEIGAAELQMQKAENARLAKELEQAKKKLQPQSWFHRKSRSVVEDIATRFS